MDAEITPLIGAAISAIGGLTYGAFGYWEAHKDEDLEPKRLIPVVIYGILGGIAGYFLTGGVALTTMAGAFTSGFTGSVMVKKMLGGASKEE